jgi:two-component system sensor histidine kinase UhpB
VRSRFVPLFWRLFIPNATVLGVACVVLMVEPANGRVPALVGGLTVMVITNVILMRRAFSPLKRLTDLMGRVDPLRPGKRIPVLGAPSEVTVLTEAFNDMLDRLESERRESGRRALTERERERRRVATELHDEIGQTLTAIALQLDRLMTRVPDELTEETAEIRNAVLAGVDEVRALARQLRPEALDALGLLPALTNLTERLSHQTGVQILRRFDPDFPALGEDADVVVYRVVQESLTNAIRHGRADCVEVSLRRTPSTVAVVVCDDGVGIEPGQALNGGIRGMRERALLVGGRLAIAPRGDRPGTEVRLELDPGTV